MIGGRWKSSNGLSRSLLKDFLTYFTHIELKTKCVFLYWKKVSSLLSSLGLASNVGITYRHSLSSSLLLTKSFLYFIFSFLVIIPVGVTPDPVPISEVKPFWADGTAGFACGRVSCRQDREDKVWLRVEN